MPLTRVEEKGVEGRKSRTTLIPQLKAETNLSWTLTHSGMITLNLVWKKGSKSKFPVSLQRYVVAD